MRMRFIVRCNIHRMNSSKPQHTVDVISDHLKIRQSRKGYRFGLDALLLSTELPELAVENPVVYELGAGQGAVSLSIASREPGWQVVAIERQPSLFGHLCENIATNNLSNVEAVQLDLREHRDVFDPHVADLVLFNPPYFPEGARRPSANAERAGAHIELHGGIPEFMAAACYVLKHRGWLKLILPPFRLPELMAAIPGFDIKLVSLRFFHADPTQDAYLFECVMRRGGALDMKIATPLFIRGEDGCYTDEVAERLAGAAVKEPSESLVSRIKTQSKA